MHETAAAASVTSPQPAKAKKVDLPSISPAIPLTVVRIEVKAGGVIDVPPGRFLAGPEEVVSWVITNNSNEEITVAMTNFIKKAQDSHARGVHTAGAYFDWLCGWKLTLGHGETDRLHARVTQGPVPPSMLDCLSYTIEVRGASFAFDYDPDGDIKP